ncbi:hypothetical protein FKN01_16445 [Streptomyces sp. 130]|uniref:hypothetical protein n=1 Tax=Streptomyces sp. 130 TaxID=2591006 RepID=UPI00117C311A|nr:hypothetical protein [Streptomyces sp. 130]TRV77327.1 hypothetical protein FKN01_16445 [Streptomyces sp. 130]
MHPNDSISDGQPEPPVDAAEAAGAGERPEAEAEPAASVKRRPRGRTALIIAAAAVLGVAGGIATGYGIQADRAPTPLAALSQPDLAYPAKALPAGQEPDPLPASQDRQVRTEGDLRKLIMPRPKGWQEDKGLTALTQDGWMGVENYAMNFENEEYMYGDLLDQGLRRVAGASWKKGEYRAADVYLVQFNSGAAAAALAEDQRSYMPQKRAAGNGGTPIKGSAEGRYYVFPAEREAGYLPFYQARAIFSRGDVMVDIHIFDSAPISEKDIRTLAERQLERL